MPTEDFSEWLEKELDRLGWSRAELARRSGISAPQITRLLNREQRPGPESIEAIASALHLRPESVYRAAGLLPPDPDYDPRLERARYLIERLGDDADEWLDIGELKVERRERNRPGEPKTQPRPTTL